jgi:phytoene synthase
VSGEISQSITRKSASNLALAFILLPPARRADMAALYAFCREVDDVADEESTPIEKRRALLNAWRADVRKACEGQSPEFPVNRELAPAIATYDLRFEHFDDLIRGVEMDLDVKRYPTYDELERYCYRVASVVGLLSIRIFGATRRECEDYAIHLGKALQLTNILRDVRNDAERGRIYLPQEELARHRVAEDEVLSFRFSDRFAAACRALATKARHHYGEARRILPSQDRKAMATAELMGAVYWELLLKLEQKNFHVLGPSPTRVSRFRKVILIARAWLRLRAGLHGSQYGTT